MFYRDYVYGCGDAHVCVCDGHAVSDSHRAGRQRFKVELNIIEKSCNYLVAGDVSLLSTESLPLAL